MSATASSFLPRDVAHDGVDRIATSTGRPCPAGTLPRRVIRCPPHPRRVRDGPSVAGAEKVVRPPRQ